jgi:uncharacterized protein (DUF58 family)
VKALVEGYLAGRHRSKDRGSSIEFQEYRQYSPGDDPAMVDWRVFARTDKHYLKTFEQETNMECHIFVDSSGSMGYKDSGELTKLEYASFFAACLAWLVIQKNDRVSLQLFDNKIRNYFESGSTSKHLYSLLDALENNKPGNPTSIAEALKKSFPLLKRKGTLVVLSDFFDSPEDIFHALNPYLHKGFKVHLFQVLDPSEQDLPDRGLARFIDMEDQSNVVLHTSSFKALWKEEMKSHIRVIRDLSSKRRVDFASLNTEQSYFELFDRLAK